MGGGIDKTLTRIYVLFLLFLLFGSCWGRGCLFVSLVPGWFWHWSSKIAVISRCVFKCHWTAQLGRLRVAMVPGFSVTDLRVFRVTVTLDDFDPAPCGEEIVRQNGIHKWHVLWWWRRRLIKKLHLQSKKIKKSQMRFPFHRLLAKNLWQSRIVANPFPHTHKLFPSLSLQHT